MPFYDLRCDKCDTEFNVRASIKERESKLIQCPRCTSNELSSLFKSANFIISDKSKKVCPHMEQCGGCCSR